VSVFQPYLSPGSNLDTAILHQPAFALRHYTSQRPRDSAAAHLYALICERIGLVEEAVSSLQRATQLLEEEFEATESEEIEKKYTMALVNLGRVRLAGQDYTGSKESFETAWELLSSSEEPDARGMKVQCQVGLGLANYWLGEVDVSLEAFQSGLEIAEGKGLKGWKEEVSVLLARTLWGLGGEDARDAAKSHLLECLSQDKPPIKVITALAATAISSNDEDLIEAALSELQQIPLERLGEEDPKGQTTLVRYAHALIQGEDAVQVLEGAVHASPSDEVARLRLAKGLIRDDKAGEAVGILGTRQGKESVDGMRMRGVAELLDGEEGGLRKVQKAVRGRPWDVEGWEALAWSRKMVAEAEEV
jgi:superkiller protein 3